MDVLLNSAPVIGPSKKQMSYAVSYTHLDVYKRQVVDAYTEEEQTVGFLTMMEDHLALPFSTNVLGVDVVAEKVDMTRDGQIVAICRHGKTRQGIGILDLPLPTPAPGGAEWIKAYRHWRRGF